MRCENNSYFFIGHFAIDTIVRKKNGSFLPLKQTLGGSVCYGTLALKTYTQDVAISIISNCGRINFDESLLERINNKKIDMRGLKWSEAHNTNFILKYFNHSRSLTIKSRSPNLKFEDIPSEYLSRNPDVIVLAPLCNEISHDYVLKILEHFPNSYIAIDPQGFIRKIDDKGNVLLLPDQDIIENFINIMRLIGHKLILKGSEEEIKILSQKEDLFDVMEYFQDFKGIIIMTLGENGSMITPYGKKVINIPAFKSRNVVDETGAGDVYFAIFLHEFLCSNKSWKSIKAAGCFASTAASFSVEEKGPFGFETKKYILERLNSKKYI